MVGVGLGMVASAPWLWAAGCGLLLLGAAVAVSGGILHDTHSAHVGRRELQALRDGATHSGRSAQELRHAPQAAEVAAGTRALLRDREGSPVPGRFPAAVILVVLGVWLLVGQWVLVYPFNVLGQNTALRDSGFAIVVTLVGLRLCATRSLPASIIGTLSGLLLITAALVQTHAAIRGTVNELLTGALIMLAALGTTARQNASHKLRHAKPAPLGSGGRTADGHAARRAATRTGSAPQVGP
jgi:hypothetical protein